MTSPFGEDFDWHTSRHLTHQIHTSERKAFRACRRRWNWVYREMYNPMVQSEPLEFGVAFHKAMETLYEPLMWKKPVEVRMNLALVAFKKTCDEHLAEYKRMNPDPDVEVIESYKTRTELGLNMLKFYVRNVVPIYDNNWVPIRVEVGFEVPIKHPETGQQLWCKCDGCWRRFTKAEPEELLEWKGQPGRDYAQIPMDEWINRYRERWNGLPITYGGRLDALFQDSSGRYWIADWKTTSRFLDEDAESSFLQLDDQIASYLWALQQYGINCAGFVYVEIKKAYPQEPELLTRKYKGRSVSTNKNFMTTHEMFLKTIQTHDPDAWQMGLYDDHLLYLKSEGPRFTQRHQIHKNAHEIQEVGRVIAMEAMDMTDVNLRVYPQPGRFSCNWCLFRQPCLGMNMGEDHQYTLDTMFEKRTKLYWETKEASTD